MNHSFGTLEGNFEDNSKILQAMLVTCYKFNLSILNVVSHEFKPQGLTTIILLAESHFSFHSYPESNEAYIDLFCCNPSISTEDALAYLAEHLDATILKLTTVRRDSWDYTQK